MTDDRLAKLEEAATLRRENAMAFFRPNKKQTEFITLGKSKRQRLSLGANQSGKTTLGAYELAVYATGQYPKDWPGRKFPGPIRAWACSETAALVREGVQLKLLGPAGNHGSGMIPRDSIVDVKAGTQSFDTIVVRHRSGQQSYISSRFYTQREHFQAATLDVCWLDEECDEDIYTEALARVSSTGGMVYMTATPMKGMSDVVRKFYPFPATGDADFNIIALEDCDHISPAQRELVIAGYPEWEKEARTKGIPMLGSGRVFQIDEASISFDAKDFQIPSHWYQLAALDFGINHPFVCSWGAHDRDIDCVYIWDIYRITNQTPPVHAATIKTRPRVPINWPHDGHQRDKGSGEELAAQYAAQGLWMAPEHAQFETGGYSLEASVLDMDTRLRTGRLKIARHLDVFWSEYRTFHRKDGLIVREHDDVISSIRYLLMSLRNAALAVGTKRRIQTRAADGNGPAEFAYIEEPGYRGMSPRLIDPRDFPDAEEE